jgi:hypothetical protein
MGVAELDVALGDHDVAEHGEGQARAACITVEGDDQRLV